MNNVEMPKNLNKGAKKIIIVALAVVVLSGVFLFFKSLSLKQAVVRTENEITIFGMYINPSNTYEVRGNSLIEITNDGEEKVIMELTNSQVKKLEKQHSRGFVIDLEK